ncbi:MAG: hypothetical protein OEW58_02390 [Gammaproteobacteria bacterium]|nr:hypothetical protein [Gammaproteobacteria bacterium]
MELNSLVIIGIFFILLFLGVWITAEYNTMSIKRKIEDAEMRVQQQEHEVLNQKRLLKLEMDKVMELQSERRELAKLKVDHKRLQDKHQLLSEEHGIFLQIIQEIKKKCQRTEFNGSHLSRIVITEIDKMMDVEKELSNKKVQIVDKDTEKMFNRIKDKMAGR